MAPRTTADDRVSVHSLPFKLAIVSVFTVFTVVASGRERGVVFLGPCGGHDMSRTVNYDCRAGWVM